jgi:aminoglycoside phosphotransferase (APT) family kinase protein
MKALREAGVPVPRVLAYSAEPAVDGRPFVLMELIDGMSVGEAVATTTPHHLVTSAFQAIRLMHAVPADETGLGGESPTALDAEVARWKALRLRAPQDLVRRAPELEELLLHALPAAGNPVLVHGDYHLNNLLFKNGNVVAILDWEIAELGQGPLDEAALCLLAVREEFGEPNAGEEAALPLEEMLSLAGAGPDFDWYMAATCHKYAAILGYNLGLHRRGRRIDPIFEELLKTIPGLIDAGIKFLGRS